jgi:pimeloyl-ACP methyl ester carboxylesterase
MVLSSTLSRLSALACAFGFASTFGLASTGASAQSSKPTVILVHGAWADASSWNGVVDLLIKDGYSVRALPNTLRSLTGDAAVISTYLKMIAGPVILVGHSYGGSVISVASANSPNVKALVFVDAFAPDGGESPQSVLASAPPAPPDFTFSVPTPDGADTDMYINSKYFGAVFASAEPADVGARLAATQRPLTLRCFTDKAPDAVGWKTIPSWYVVGDADKVIPPDIQLKFATRAKSKIYHVPGGDHPSMIAHPEVTVQAIEDAAKAISH